jgi:hypothetical protein
MQVRLARAGVLLGAGLAVAVMTTPAGAANAQPGTGSAYAVDAHVSLLPGVLGSHALTVQTGPLAASNTKGPNSASTVDATLKGLVSAKVLTSSSKHNNDGTVVSTAATTQVALPLLRGVAGATPTASVITAQCKSNANGITGSSDLADLNLGKIGHVSAATPNLKLGIPGVVEVIANEQIHNADGSLTVNALDIKLLGGKLLHAVGSGRIVISSATCAAATTPPTTPPSSPPPSTGPTTPPSSTPPSSTPPSTGPTTPPSNTAPSSGPTSPTAPTSSGSAATPVPTESATPTPPQTVIVPVGAPQTGDGSLATVVVH